MDLAKRLAKESTELLRSGIDFRSYAPSYFFTKLEDLKLDLLEEAAANSKLRAERLAKSAGNRVVGVTSARRGFSDHPAELHPDLQLGHVRHFVDREKSEGRRHDGVSHRVAPTHPLSQKKTRATRG